jgi:NarL family two-component system response regulator LiaR
MNRPVSLLICDDHRILTDAIAALVRTDPRLQLVAGPVDNGNDAISLCAKHRPDVVLMDIELRGDMDGIEATRGVKKVSPTSNVVVVTGHKRSTVLVEAVEAGASGFLDKNAAIDDLLALIHGAADGEMLIEPSLLATLMPKLAAERRVASAAQAKMARLTPREREILALMTHGHSTDSIAKRLVISRPTVRTHVQNLLSKLEVHSQLEAVALAAQAD